MHFSWNVDIGQVVTWTLAIGTLVYKMGEFTETLKQLTLNLTEFKTEFKTHAEDDKERFEGMQQTINQILWKGMA